jgi:hypothetical protein
MNTRFQRHAAWLAHVANELCCKTPVCNHVAPALTIVDAYLVKQVGNGMAGIGPKAIAD